MGNKSKQKVQWHVAEKPRDVLAYQLEMSLRITSVVILQMHATHGFCIAYISVVSVFSLSFLIWPLITAWLAYKDCVWISD